MKLNQELVQRLSAGEIQLKDTGTVEQLNEILMVAFPDNSEVNGYRMYYESADYNNCWYYDDTPSNLPIYTTEQFFEAETDTKQTMDAETRELAKQLFVAKTYAGTLPSANAMNQAISNAKEFMQLLNNE